MSAVAALIDAVRATRSMMPLSVVEQSITSMTFMAKVVTRVMLTAGFQAGPIVTMVFVVTDMTTRMNPEPTSHAWITIMMI